MKAAVIGSRSLTVDDLGKYKKTALFVMSGVIILLH